MPDRGRVPSTPPRYADSGPGFRPAPRVCCRRERNPMHPDTRARRGMRALVLTIATMFTLVSTALIAEPASAAHKPPSSAALGASWMANQITANGGFVKSFGSADPVNTAYAVIGMHAAKIGGGAGDLAMSYL